LERTFHDLYENSSDIIQLERFLNTRSKHPAKVDELISILSFVDIMKDDDISLQQDVLSLESQK
jgi:hypothetical protein